jgi:hypothetical protein
VTDSKATRVSISRLSSFEAKTRAKIWAAEQHLDPESAYDEKWIRLFFGDDPKQPVGWIYEASFRPVEPR